MGCRNITLWEGKVEVCEMSAMVPRLAVSHPTWGPCHDRHLKSLGHI